MDEKAVIISITGITMVLLLLSAGFVLFIYFSFRAKRKNLEEKQVQQLFFSEQLRTIQGEIKDETLQFMKRELHDNIGQLLTLQKLHLNNMMKSSKDEQLVEMNDIVLKTISETKELTSSLKSFSNQSTDLIDMVTSEMDRINKIPDLTAKMTVSGKNYSLKEEEESLVIFRLIQEFLNNSMKHSQGECFEVNIDFEDDELSLILKDNGIGFDLDAVTEGKGLKYMAERVNMLNGTMKMSSDKRGTILTMNIKRPEV